MQGLRAALQGLIYDPLLDALEILRLATSSSDFITLRLYASKFDETFTDARHQFKTMSLSSSILLEKGIQVWIWIWDLMDI